MHFGFGRKGAKSLFLRSCPFIPRRSVFETQSPPIPNHRSILIFENPRWNNDREQKGKLLDQTTGKIGLMQNQIQMI